MAPGLSALPAVGARSGSRSVIFERNASRKAPPRDAGRVCSADASALVSESREVQLVFMSLFLPYQVLVGFSNRVPEESQSASRAVGWSKNSACLGQPSGC